MLALSNPTRKAEATVGQIIEGTKAAHSATEKSV